MSRLTHALGVVWCATIIILGARQAFACDGSVPEACPTGWLEDTDGTCFKVAAPQELLLVDQGPDGGQLATVGVPFDDMGGVVKATLAFEYDSGGCWDSSTKDAIMLECATDRWRHTALGQCETGAPGV